MAVVTVMAGVMIPDPQYLIPANQEYKWGFTIVPQ
jgi:hypothetical protein